MTVPLAPDCRLEPAPDLRTIDGGRILIGGAPLRILRLQSAGAELVQCWFAGEPVADRPAHHDLARRLEHNGMANIRWPTNEADRATDVGLDRDGDQVREQVREQGRAGAAVVIPTHDDQAELARTLAIEPQNWADEVIVVDDGSAEPVAAPSAAIRVLRRPTSGGPGAARQTGLEAIGAPIVVFLDAGVTLGPDDAAGLLGAFDDPAVVAAAPRVRSESAAHLVARYDRQRSPLDLGPDESLVGPGRRVTYVPTACLAVRTDAIRSVGGFDTDLRYGEDVDLVWRLAEIGIVRYLPRLTVRHRPRPSIPAMLAQRRAYGSAAAPLARRHGSERLSPCRVSPWSALVLGLGLAGRPLAALVTALGTGVALRPKLEPMPDAGAEAMVLTLRGHWYGGLSILTAANRSWFPLLLPLLALGGWPRRLAATTILAATARRGLDGPREPAGAAIDLGLGLADDLAYCTGLWQGVIEHRSAAALRPVLASWPGSRPDRRSLLESVRARVGGRRRPAATRR